MKKIIPFVLAVLLVASGCTTPFGDISSEQAQILFDKAMIALHDKIEKGEVPPIPEPTPPEKPGDPVVNAADDVNYGSLVWDYGGFNGKGSIIHESVRISNLTFNKNNLYYKWVSGGCEELGASSSGDYGATICAVFFKENDGVWRGGKFDWVSTSRTSRGLENVHDGYNEWTLSRVPARADACFVIVSVKTGRRTNVIKGTYVK